MMVSPEGNQGVFGEFLQTVIQGLFWAFFADLSIFRLLRCPGGPRKNWLFGSFSAE